MNFASFRRPSPIARFLVAILLACTFGATAAAAATLRWASRGDIQTMDPYSQNEGMTTNFANLIHDVCSCSRDQAT